jgi:hypothetical protein
MAPRHNQGVDSLAFCPGYFVFVASISGSAALYRDSQKRIGRPIRIAISNLAVPNAVSLLEWPPANQPSRRLASELSDMFLGNASLPIKTPS